MIRRILRAELSDVRALAYELKHRAARAYHRNFYLGFNAYSACVILGEGRGRGAGYVIDDPEAHHWPDGARLLTIGRVTLAAWGGRPS